MDISLGSEDQVKRRKAKEERRRQVKMERKNKLKEHQNAQKLNPQKQQEKKQQQLAQELNKEAMTLELLKDMNMAEKITLIKTTALEIIQSPEEKYRKLKDLLVFCQEPKDIDVVLKSIQSLCEVYCDILPTYRLREHKNIDTNEADGGKQSHKISKDVQQMREYEQTLLNTYKEYLKILEVFAKTKPERLIKKQGLTKSKEEEEELEAKRRKAFDIYRKLREASFIAFNKLLKRHPHFNYRLNILQMIMPKLSTNDITIRNACTETLFDLLKRDDNTLLDFKLEILKELSKTLKTQPHSKMAPHLLDSLVCHQIIVDEAKAKIIDESSRKLDQLKQQMEKLRKKGQYSDYKEMKQQLLREMKESDAIGLDLGKTSSLNNAIIKQILEIYFDILKNKNDSPLLKSVFLGLPQFTSFVNIEIVWDLINVMREYLKMELDIMTHNENEKVQVRTRKSNISNVLTGLLCSFQIIDIGAGTAFNVEEKDFIDTLYSVINRLFENPIGYQTSDFLAFLKCMTIVFIQRRQYSNELVNAFVKRLASVQLHMKGPEQIGLLLLVKQIMTKYPTTKSNLIELDDEGLTNAFTATQGIYKPDINDPQLANASQSSITLELLATINQGLRSKNPSNDPAYKLAKSILYSEGIPQEYLGLTALEAVKRMIKASQF